jgi:hypothetical protein
MTGWSASWLGEPEPGRPAVVPETELQVGDAYVVGVSRSSDQKCSPARPLPTAYFVSVSTSAGVKVSLEVSFTPIIG